ncbi:MAG: anthranilate phosphoribosyltransferase [Actinomycetota bacterium]|nr:anthranilate phosphoribosyltransferase [Actinomycetota bacterium]
MTKIAQEVVTSDVEWKAVLKTLMNSESISFEVAYSAMAEILSGSVDDIVTSSFLTALRAKGESIDEMRGLARAMVDSSTRVSIDGVVLDTCGTGGDQKHSVNVSTMTAVVVASAGVKVAKHGNRAASSLSGSADVLETLGVKIDLDANGVERCIRETNIGFCLAPKFNSAMANVSKVRRTLAVPTTFNFLGPLINPARASRQVVGVFEPTMLSSMAEVLADLGSDHALLAHSKDGYDELSTTSPNFVVEVKRDGDEVFYEEYILDGVDYGLERASSDDLKGGTAKYNASVFIDLLEGKKGAVREIVLLNVGAGLYVSSVVGSIKEGIEAGAELIDSSKALATLERFIAVSNQ